MPEPPVVRVEDLEKTYASGTGSLTVFRGLNLTVPEGDQIAIMGESGAGKSTLLHLIAGLDMPSSGHIFHKGRDIGQLSQKAQAELRNREIGYVWQQHHLLPEFTAEENVLLPLLAGGTGRREALRLARERLEEVGLGPRAHHRAGELSGGEQQRVAIARALVASPSLLLADEPTGNLDEKTGLHIFELLAAMRERRRLTTILVTHNLQFASSCGTVLRLEGGILHPA